MAIKEVAIAGAGIIGLSTALELALAGAHVTVFERGLAMGEASWAAAGMLAPADPGNPPELRALSAFSFGLYPEFLATIERLSGKQVPILATKTLEGSPSLPPNANLLSAETINALAPSLRVKDLKFYLLEEICFDPRSLGAALVESIKAAGVVLKENTTVHSVQSGADGVQLQTTAGTFRADEFINACGAWATEISGVPIAPRKGQLLLVRHPRLYADQHLTAVVRIPRLYLIPRPNHSVLIGSTIEDAGFNKSVDAATIESLRQRAADLWPPVADAQIIDSWAGLRPASPDSLPVIGAKEPHHWLALGHFRNGILLAPGTARLIRQLVMNQPVALDLHHFAPARLRTGRS